MAHILLTNGANMLDIPLSVPMLAGEQKTVQASFSVPRGFSGGWSAIAVLRDITDTTNIQTSAAVSGVIVAPVPVPYTFTLGPGGWSLTYNGIEDTVANITAGIVPAGALMYFEVYQNGQWVIPSAGATIPTNSSIYVYLTQGVTWTWYVAS
jgi:hypothetical protein